MNFVYYSQTDPKWNDIAYGNCPSPSTIGSSGCGIASMAMIVSSLSNKAVEPPQMALLAVKNGFRKCGNGTLHEIVPFVSKKYNLKYVSLGTDLDQAKTVLSNGGLIWASFGLGIFTSEGHIMVIKSFVGGLFYIADPNSQNGKTKGQSNLKGYTTAELLGPGAIKAMYGLKNLS